MDMPITHVSNVYHGYNRMIIYAILSIFYGLKRNLWPYIQFINYSCSLLKTPLITLDNLVTFYDGFGTLKTSLTLYVRTAAKKCVPKFFSSHHSFLHKHDRTKKANDKKIYKNDLASRGGNLFALKGSNQIKKIKGNKLAPS